MPIDFVMFLFLQSILGEARSQAHTHGFVCVYSHYTNMNKLQSIVILSQQETQFNIKLIMIVEITFEMILHSVCMCGVYMSFFSVI